MNWFQQLFSRRRLYDDVSAEIREHLEEKAEELVAGGMTRKQASAAARRFTDHPEPALVAADIEQRNCLADRAGIGPPR